jgi:hypothetical protein
MTIIEDIAKIPRKQKNGLGGDKTVTSVYIRPNILAATRIVATAHHVSISGVIELALERVLEDIKAEQSL